MDWGRLWRRAVPCLVIAALVLAAVGSPAQPVLSVVAPPAPASAADTPPDARPEPPSPPPAAPEPAAQEPALEPAPVPPPAPPPATSPAAEDPPLVASVRARVPVLMYHVIGDGSSSLYVAVGDFEAQMDWLAKNGYHPVTLRQLYRNQTGGEALPDKPLVITFDDGYASFYTVGYPAFRKHRFPAVLFAVPGFFGRPGYVTAEQVLEMDRGGLIEIGSHTLHHHDLPSLGEAELTREVAGSKRDLEERLGHSVDFFCYPAGAYNAKVLAAVKAAGYLGAVTTKYGAVTPEQNSLEWRRIRISRGTSLDGFAAQIKGASE